MSATESISILVAAMEIAGVKTIGELVDYCAVRGISPQQLVEDGAA